MSGLPFPCDPLTLAENIAPDVFGRSLDCVQTQDLNYTSPSGRIEAWLETDGAAGLLSDGGPTGRYSYLMAAPETCLRLDYGSQSDPLDCLNRAIGALNAPRNMSLPPFSGGVIGLAAFELGARLEALPRQPFHLDDKDDWPELTLLRYPAVLAFDHHERRLIAIGRGDTPDRASQALENIVAAWQAARDDEGRALAEAPLASPPEPEISDACYETNIANLIERIHAGDLFQANLARGHKGTLIRGVTPGLLMRRILSQGQAPFGAFLRLGSLCVLSNSPERFISLTPDGKLESRPIKGTRPRGDTPKSDAANARELLASEKDRAENLMIVDLMRHDLSRVALPGTVMVEALNALETYPNVHHLVSTITARLRPDKTAADVLCETFPPGSISGAPKVQALKVIAATEPPRGPYCGSLFFVSADGGMDSNVLIRTIALQGDDNEGWAYRLCGGGGIVADSDPADERRESDTKLSLLTAALTGRPKA